MDPTERFLDLVVGLITRQCAELDKVMLTVDRLRELMLGNRAKQDQIDAYQSANEERQREVDATLDELRRLMAERLADGEEWKKS